MHFRSARFGCLASVLLATPVGAQFVGGLWESQIWTTGEALGVPDLGSRIVNVGDVDGDGMSDIAVSNCRSLIHSFAEGPVIILSGATASPLVTILNPMTTTGTGFGRGLAGPGDLDRDGIPDVVVGAPEAELGFPGNAGSIRAFSGANGALLWESFGNVGSARIGEALAVIDDMDADLVADLVSVESVAGAERVLVLSGRHGGMISAFRVTAPLSFVSLSAIDDLDGDQLRDIVVGGSGPWNPAYALQHTFQGYVGVVSSSTGALLGSWMGAEAYSSFGYLVAGAPDLDGDARPDLFAVAKGGGVAGNPPDLFALSPSTGTMIWKQTAIMPRSGYMISLGCLPDLDFDGAVEAMFAGPSVLASGASRGALRIFSGADGESLITVPGIQSSDQFGSALIQIGSNEDGDAPAILIGDIDLENGSKGALTMFRLDPFLTASRTEISATAGGATVFDLHFPASCAGRAYALLASGTGIGSSSLGGATVPLTQDSLFHRMLHSPPRQFVAPTGQLDGNAQASSSLLLAPGAAASAIGRSFWFASVAEDSGGPPRSSVARRLRVEP